MTALAFNALSANILFYDLATVASTKRSRERAMGVTGFEPTLRGWDHTLLTIYIC